jgi:dephospho-CoA kinase
MIVIGLTGSIGMGKSTTAGLFAEAGTPVWDADAAVHRLYAPGGAAVAPVAEAFPGVVVDGGIDRPALSRQLHGHPDAFARLEAIVHPLVAEDRAKFLDRARTEGADVVVLDIPLLFEGAGHKLVDVVVVASAPAHIQRERVLARPGMDAAKLAAILERQTPDDHKRAHADFVVDTSRGIDAAREQVLQILETVRAGLDVRAKPQH